MKSMKFIMAIFIAGTIGVSFGMWQVSVYAGEWMYIISLFSIVTIGYIEKNDAVRDHFIEDLTNVYVGKKLKIKSELNLGGNN